MKKMTLLLAVVAILGIVATGAEARPVNQDVFKLKIVEDGSITFEGSATNAYQTVVNVVNPTADRTILLPNASGTLLLSSGSADIVLDDGSGASPTLTFQDGTDETGVFQKADAGFVTLTTVAGDGFNVLVGNLKVGNGTPDVTLNGEDAYIEGTAEVDGNIRLDGAIDANSTLNLQGAATFQSTIASGAITSTAGIAGTTGLFSSTVTANALASTTTVTGASATFTGQMQSATTNVTGTATANAVAATGTVTGASADFTGEMECATTNVTGTASANAVAVTSTITGASLDVTGEVEAATTNITGTATANAVAVSTAVNAATGDFTGATIQLSATMGAAIGYTSAIQIINGTIIAEGATQDTKETTVAFQDPLSDTTFSVPTNYTDGTVFPIIGLGMDVTAYSATNATADAQTLTITDGFFSAGKAIRIPFAGTVAGTNAGKQVVLYIDNAIIGTLDIAAATEGDFHGEFIVAEYTDFAHQRVTGFLQTAVAADADADTNVDTTDFNDGGTNVIKLQVISANAGDDAQILYSHAELIQ